MSSAALSLDKVSLAYETGLTAIDNISAAFPAGGFTALVGPSGCGKSSLLRLLAGLQPPTAGRVNSVPQTDIGFVFQEPALLTWRSAAANIALPLAMARLPKHVVAARVEEALQLVGLADRADALPRELSGGMKMRVSLARALAKRPPVLLMDEPFAALDEMTRFRLDDDLRGIWQQTGCTIVFVTHSITEAAYLAERAMVMQNGRMVQEINIGGLPAAERTPSFRTDADFHAACAALTGALEQELAA